jgi:hypothetical protein
MGDESIIALVGELVDEALVALDGVGRPWSDG